MRKVLVANRGEIACRVLRCLREQGLQGVAVYSDADRHALHVELADQAVRIGPAPVAQSYLNGQALIDAALASGADAVHPGYGFLSEDADFAQSVADAGLTFIGPSPQAILAMADKATARGIMTKAGVPCVPGYDGADQSDDMFQSKAAEIGFPVMIKAAAGGGGRGMRLVTAPEDLSGLLDVARSEAEASFNSSKMILEKAISRARHIEIQILADQHGTTLHLGERDCSLQRRHQKIIEEAPAPGLSDALRNELGESAVKAAKAIDYVGASTVEFLLGHDGAFYFLEMNTRLQVEHPVTECVTGLDLVALQLEIARGAALSVTQAEVSMNGHAIEARLYAEDPDNSFLPQTGDVLCWQPGQAKNLRIDSGIQSSSTVTPHYDPMLAKVIASGQTREEARQRLRDGLADMVVLGLKTNSDFLHRLLSLPEFVAGKATTDLVDALPAQVAPACPPKAAAMIAAALLECDRQEVLKSTPIPETLLGWSSADLPALPVNFTIEDQAFDITAKAQGLGWHITITNQSFFIEFPAPDVVVVDGIREKSVWHATPRGDIWLAFDHLRLRAKRLQTHDAKNTETSNRIILSPMPGKLVTLNVQTGQEVQSGDILAVVEAMKMQHQIIAPTDATVHSVTGTAGQQIDMGAQILTLDPKQSGEN